MSWAINSEEAFGAKIKVIGVGGGGGNALNCIAAEASTGSIDYGNVDYIAVNTDIQALKKSMATEKIQIGTKLTHGLGAGGKPEVGESSAQENKEEIAEALKDADMVVITAGMGGGTGTGAAPVVAEISRELGKLTIAVVTKPFAFEGARKMAQAERGIEELLKNVDSLIVIPNQKLLSGEQKLTMRQAFSLSDGILKTGVMSVADIILRNGVVNVDFADVTSILKDAGYAHIAIGHGQGKDKAQEAAKQVISSPLLETSINGARRLLINIVMSDDIVTDDVDELTNIITNAVDPEATIIFGTDYKEDSTDEIFITVIAADFADSPSPAASYSAPVAKAEAPSAPAAKTAGDNPEYYEDIFNIFSKK
ncbi:MAG: cell division protein FtsZ [Oscillospiraceae bacterium]|nr:cell division protein FtsZ [Oscillospiraceae bacterium]